MAYEDKTILCVDCGAEFKFTADEQKVFADKGFVNGPKRCKPCREARKASQTTGNRAGANTMTTTGNSAKFAAPNGGRGGYGRQGGGGGGGDRGGRGGFNAGPKQLFPATCAQCGKQTEVPFKPSGARPVYCRDCFQGQRAAGGR